MILSNNSNHLNIENKLRYSLAKVILAKDANGHISVKDILSDIHKAFNEELYPWISLEIKKRIRDLLDQKEEQWFTQEELKRSFLNSSPEVALSSIFREIDIDFSDIDLDQNPDNIADITQQANEAKNYNVPNEYNGTIWVLIDNDWNIVANPKIIEVLQNNLWLDLSDRKQINNLLKYAPWNWYETFRKTIELLITYEEQYYNWENPQAAISRPFIIPGWVWGLTLSLKYFLREYDLVVVPEYRRPNIDGIVMDTTKVPVCEVNMMNDKWNIELQNIENILDTALLQRRKNVSLYLNFPNNPTGTRFWESDAKKLNDLLSKYDTLNIQIILDDPYWAFSTDSEGKIVTPLSYYINTQDNKHITLIELGSHGTKEAWAYWLRTSVLRIFTHDENLKKMEEKISKAIRKTFSMSNSINQVIMSKAIMWSDIDVFDDHNLDNLSQEDINKRVWKYIKAREKMLDVIYPKLDDFRDSIINTCGKYLNHMDNKVDWVSETWGFFQCFSLTDYAKQSNLNLDELRKICISASDNDKCSFAVFKNSLSWDLVIRISLVSWSVEEFSRRLYKWISTLIHEV
jgi:hypothetical protein